MFFLLEQSKGGRGEKEKKKQEKQVEFKLGTTCPQTHVIYGTAACFVYVLLYFQNTRMASAQSDLIFVRVKEYIVAM